MIVESVVTSFLYIFKSSHSISKLPLFIISCAEARKSAKSLGYSALSCKNFEAVLTSVSIISRLLPEIFSNSSAIDDM